jgi:hypothetical protein
MTGRQVPAPYHGNVSQQKGGSYNMHRIPVTSTEITQVGYQEDSETLEIKFVHGGLYQFFNVPSDVFEGLLSAPSKESYYHTKIGERFPCSRVG